jgi:serine/threonine protein kinase
MSDFELMQELGAGGFGKVYLAKMISNQSFYAIKCQSKAHIQQKGVIDLIELEKDIMFKNENPFLVKMDYCF